MYVQSGDTCLQKAVDAGNVTVVKYMVKIRGKPLLHIIHNIHTSCIIYIYIYIYAVRRHLSTEGG